MLDTEIEKYAGKGADAHKIRVGPTSIYFSGNQIIGINRFDDVKIKDGWYGGSAARHRGSIPRGEQQIAYYSRDSGRTFTKNVNSLMRLLGRNVTVAQLEKFAGPSANAVALVCGTTKLYFSYDYLVAIRDDNTLYCSEDIWGRTIKRHIGIIQPDVEARIPRADFEELAHDYIIPFIVEDKLKWVD